MDRPRKWMALKRITYTEPLDVDSHSRSRRKCEDCKEGLGAAQTEAFLSTDLGGSSKYLSEILKD